MPAPLSFHALARVSMVAVAVGGPLVDGSCDAADRSAGTPEVIVFNDNGAWSWFEDERAVVDAAGGKLLVSSVANAAGTGGSSRDGNVEVVAYDLATGAVERAVLHPALQADDHNSAALYVRPDGRYVAMYSKHATDRLSRWRVTDRPGDVTAWEPEATPRPRRAGDVLEPLPPRATATGCTASPGPPGAIPTSSSPTTGASTWRSVVACSTGPGARTSATPTDGAGRIHLVTTDQHPADYANRIYHGVVVDGRLLRSDGTVVDADVFDPHAAAPQRLTEVHRGTDRDHAWTIDLAVDDRGRPSAVFSVSTEPGGARQQATGVAGTHRYYYARYDGTDLVRPLPRPRRTASCTATSPSTPAWSPSTRTTRDRVFVSTDVHPATGRPLVSAADGRRHHELFEGEDDRWRRDVAVATHHRRLDRRQHPPDRARLGLAPHRAAVAARHLHHVPGLRPRRRRNHHARRI